MLKNFQQIRSLYINCSSLLSSFTKYYCTTKKSELKEATALNKIPDHEAFGVLSDDEEILQKMLTEKEKDACVQSRLSKEYRTILANRVGKLDKSGLGLLLDPEEVKSPCWDEIRVEEYTCKAADNLVKNNKGNQPPLEKNSTSTPSNKAGSGSSGAASSIKSTGSGGGQGIQKSGAFNRPVRGDPGKVLFAFIPVEWWKFFMPKTGVTGMGTFVFTFGTYLVSKEIYVLEHNYYNGLSMLVLAWGCVKYVGPMTAKMLDKEVDQYERQFSKAREDEMKHLEDEMVNEKYVQFQTEGQVLLMEAKRENVLLQLEEAFRLRQMYVYDEVKKKLDYQVRAEQVRRQYMQKNLVDYVQREVLKAVSPDMQDKLIYYSIDSILRELEKGDKK